MVVPQQPIISSVPWITRYLATSDPGTIYECQECGKRTLQPDECPACGSENLEPVVRGP